MSSNPLHLQVELKDSAAAWLYHGPCQQGSAFWEVSLCELPTAGEGSATISMRFMGSPLISI